MPFPLTIFAAVGLFSHIDSEINKWQLLEKGLHFAEFASGRSATSGDSVISVLKIDPRFFRLRYAAAMDYDSTNRTLREWAVKCSLMAAVNAGMYAKDYLTHVGYVKHRGHIQSPRFLRTYKSVLAFNPITEDVPEVQLIDIQCQDFKNLKKKYGTLVQNIRMLSCRRRNVWSPQKKKWSTAALGQDSSGCILFLFTRSPYAVHDFIDILMNLPLSLSRAMYLEGGSPAGFYLKHGSKEIYKTGLPEGSDGKALFPLAMPNVIGVVRK